jgi:glycerol-3-phosphate O-acyltransferase
MEHLLPRLSVDPRTGSHPSVRFDSRSAVPGPLLQLADGRQTFIDEVVQRTAADFALKDQKTILAETLFLERARLRRSKGGLMSPFLWQRQMRDRAVIGSLSGALDSGAANPKELTKQLLEHYSSEICGKFSASVYDFAVTTVPWGFSWLLNTASLQNFTPWGRAESLASRVRVVGEVPMLQKLAKQGTVLLVPTHQSNIDSILVGWVIHLCSLPPFAYGAGLNLFSNPVLSFLMSRLGAYTVDRQKSSELYKTALKNYSTTILGRGIHSIFFPGGGRSRSGALESHIKLGLLGTALQAQIENFQQKKPNPSLFIVPMVTSYHFVFEASSLIEDFLSQVGKHRFRPNDSAEGFPLKALFKFFWKVFSQRTEVWVRVGKPLDVFGNFVNEDGVSIGPNGTTIDTRSWLTSGGVLQSDPQRDREYTRVLGDRLVERYHAENVVLSSHASAFAYIQCLRHQYPHMDLFKMLRLSRQQRAIPMARFLEEAEKLQEILFKSAAAGKLFLSDSLYIRDAAIWTEEGIRQLGMFHERSVLRVDDSAVTSDDISLAIYYRNRLAGYGFGVIHEQDRKKAFYGETDGQGFLV